MFDQLFRRTSNPSTEALTPEAVPALPAAPPAEPKPAAKAKPEAPEFANVIAADARISGPITTCGSMKIAGVVEGRVGAGATLAVELGGQVLGGIEGTDVTVRGVVRGDVEVTGRLTIASTGRVHGNVQAKAVVVDDGGILEGRCSMGKVPTKKQVAREAEADFLNRMMDDDEPAPLGLAPALA